MRSVMMTLTAAAIAVTAMPAQAQPRGDDRYYDRQYVDRNEVRNSRDRVQAERRDLRNAYRSGSPQLVRREQKDLRRAEREFRQDSRDWQRGRQFNYNRPDPRYNGYYADNYYRGGGNYAPIRLGANDRIYRGQDNRYYCRRNDGTTGLIIGALGGGVLGNVIAPGGSKTLGSVIGGGLGAVLGNSIGSNNVTCR